MSHQFKKQFGQNFLTNPKWIQKILSVAEINKEDVVLEIGPGDGRVTAELLKIAKQVISVEIDTTLLNDLNTKFKDFKNFTLINQDILQLDLATLDIDLQKIKLIGSLPYNISKKIIRKFLENNQLIKSMTFIVQKEVGASYAAQVPDATFLSNYVQIYSLLTYHGKIPKEHFYPKPKVDGAIIKISNLQKISSQKTVLQEFIKLGFTHPRKKVSSVICKGTTDKVKFEEKLVELGYKLSARAQEIKHEDWQKLQNSL
ncbi:MAG: 16S rRNA (adenine(1518)-N(6)/adenine(1519)-N(6))-dimethyltransferase RsmA [bacterium]